MPLRWLTGARSSVIELAGTHLRRPEAEAIRKLVHRVVVGTGTFDPGCGDQMAADTTGTGLVARTSRRCSIMWRVSWSWERRTCPFERSPLAA